MWATFCVERIRAIYHGKNSFEILHPNHQRCYHESTLLYVGLLKMFGIWNLMKIKDKASIMGESESLQIICAVVITVE